MPKLRKKHLVNVLVALVGIGVVSGIVFSANNHSHHQALAATTYAPPASIASNCSSDATGALNAWFASLPANSTVNLPTNGCYLVSNSRAALLTIQNTNGLTINGDGTTLEQTSYAGGTQDILGLYVNSNITINDLTIKGPGVAGGAGAEGDAGLMLQQDKVALLNNVTITSTDGDGLDLYPCGGNDCGVNWNVTVDNSTLENIGYHAIVPEAADGFTFENSTITNGDIDAEVDFSCGTATLPLADCGTMADPDIGVVNMTYDNDSFPNGLALLDGMSCMPVGNWTIDNNNFGSGGLNLQFDTTYSLSLSALTNCGSQTGLTVENNTSTDTTQNPCCGGGSPYVVLQGWSNVTFANNHFVYQPPPAYFATSGLFADMWGDSNVSFKNNTLTNMATIDYTGGAPSGWPADTNVTDCGNVYGAGGTTTQAVCTTAKPLPAPTAPTGLKVSSNIAGSVSLSWTAATDSGGPGLGGYYVQRDGANIASFGGSATTYTDKTVSPGTTYSYAVGAYDKSSPTEYSGISNTVSVTTPSVTVPPPSAPSELSAKASSASSVVLSWKASTDAGGPGLGGYYILRNGVDIGSFGGSATTYTDKTADANTAYTYSVGAYDKSDPTEYSAASSSANVVTPKVADTTPPSQPTNLTATAVSSSQVNLSWTASTDNVGVADYTVWRSTGTSAATKIATVTTTSYGSTNLSPSTSYSYYIEAVDAAGNSSRASTTVSATTKASTPTTVILGVVTNVFGQPLANVYVHTGDKGSAAGMVSTYTNSAGEYGLTNMIPSTPHTITYALAGYGTVQYVTDYPAGLFGHNVTLHSANAVITGVVTNASGKPLANVHVYTGSGGSTTGAVSSHTNAAGGYVLTNLIPSTSHIITYSLTGYKSIKFISSYPAGIYSHNVTLSAN